MDPNAVQIITNDQFVDASVFFRTDPNAGHKAC